MKNGQMSKHWMLQVFALGPLAAAPRADAGRYLA